MLPGHRFEACPELDFFQKLICQLPILHQYVARAPFHSVLQDVMLHYSGNVRAAETHVRVSFPPFQIDSVFCARNLVSKISAFSPDTFGVISAQM